MGGSFLGESTGAEILRRHGIAVTFALILLGVVLGMVPSSISHTEEMMKQHTIRDQEELVLLRLICQHTAKDREEQNACIQAPVASRLARTNEYGTSR
jgi:hypothetical protein